MSWLGVYIFFFAPGTLVALAFGAVFIQERANRKIAPVVAELDAIWAREDEFKRANIAAIIDLLTQMKDEDVMTRLSLESRLDELRGSLAEKPRPEGRGD
jgi:hypothetical protein